MDFDADVVIVGGGAAGLSAGLVLGRARRRVLVVDAGAPRNAPAAHMQGFLSRDGMPPQELLAAGRDELQRYAVEVASDEVVGAVSGFTLSLASGRRVNARRLLLATGAGDELPEIAGAGERWGRDLLHCPYCHGWEVRDRPIGVLGLGPGSVDHGQLLHEWTADLIFFAHNYALSAGERAGLEARGVEVVDGRVAELVVAADRLRGVRLEDGRSVAREAIFFRPVMYAHTAGLAESLGCELNAAGFVQVDAMGQTSAPGVWAAGNVADPRAQVITAAGQGSAAAIAINADLVAEDVELARSQASGVPISQ